MSVRIASEPALTNNTNFVAPPIPLKVTFGGTELTTTGTTLTQALLFPSGDITGGSVAQMLRIAQRTAGVVTHAGTYRGVVSVVITPMP